jgi:alpha-galactosidase
VAKISKKPADEAERGFNGILELRRLHIALDQSVLAAYGWNQEIHSPLAIHHSPPIHLGHDFHEVETLAENDRVRYTISPAARKELLKHLLALNHARAAEEASSEASSPATKPHSRRKSKATDAQGDLFS